MALAKNNKRYLMFGIGAVLIIFVAILMLNGANNSSNAESSMTDVPSQSVAQQDEQYPEAPAFTLNDLNGKEVSLSDFKGKVVFVNFWATWCPPCRKEIPAFIELIDQYGDDGFVILGVAVDPREFQNVDKVKPFAKEMGINYPVVYDTKGVSQLYGGIRSIPTTFVINREGKVVGRIVGSRPKDVFEGIIKDLL
ncbi:TlpA family protein disulfide reductase [Calditrichota bacterium LG25]